MGQSDVHSFAERAKTIRIIELTNCAAGVSCVWLDVLQKWGVFLWQSGGALHPLSHTVTPRRQCSPQPENNPRHTERLEVANHWHDLSFSLKWRVIQWNWPAGSSERHMLLLVRVSQLLIRLVCNNQQPIEEKHTDQMNYSISSWCPQTAVHSFCAACC